MNPIMTSRIDALAARTAPLFAEYPLIKAVYLFGSVADGTDDARSDLDFGVLCERGSSPLECGRLQMELAGRLIGLLNTDLIDLVVLNHARSIDLRFAVVQDGIRIYTRSSSNAAALEADLDAYERHVRHEYWDYQAMRRRLGTVRARP